jgi:hypothetical protein
MAVSFMQKAPSDRLAQAEAMLLSKLLHAPDGLGTCSALLPAGKRLYRDFDEFINGPDQPGLNGLPNSLFLIWRKSDGHGLSFRLTQPFRRRLPVAR